MAIVVVINGVPRDCFSMRALPANWPDTPSTKTSEEVGSPEMPREIQPVDMFGTDLPASWPYPPATMQSSSEAKPKIRPIGLDAFEWRGGICYF